MAYSCRTVREVFGTVPTFVATSCNSCQGSSRRKLFGLIDAWHNLLRVGLQPRRHIFFLSAKLVRTTSCNWCQGGSDRKLFGLIQAWRKVAGETKNSQNTSEQFGLSVQQVTYSRRTVPTVPQPPRASRHPSELLRVICGSMVRVASCLGLLKLGVTSTPSSFATKTAHFS